MNNEFALATLAGGCFWCTEAVFRRLKGVEEVIPGYTGGSTSNPTYEQVCSGQTGHAEAIQIRFDPKVISFKTLMKVFWKLHDPTTLNQQGADVGTQYRSAIFYHDNEQKNIAEQSKKEVGESSYYSKKVVTEIVPASEFYPAEGYHKDYYEYNKDKSYCQIAIDPKIQKLYRDFKGHLKEN